MEISRANLILQYYFAHWKGVSNKSSVTIYLYHPVEGALEFLRQNLLHRYLIELSRQGLRRILGMVIIEVSA